MKTVEEQMRELLVRSRDALAECHDVNVWPASRGSDQMTVLNDLYKFLGMPKQCPMCGCQNELDRVKCDECGQSV